MPDSKITALTSISTSTDPANDPLVIVDVSDTSMAATGTTKKVTLNQLLGASGTATFASATITGDLTVDTSTLKVDSANNRVGIGTASPTETLHVSGGAGDGVVKVSNSSSGNSYIIARTTGEMDVFNAANSSIRFSTNGTLQATLNSTGLGVGRSPSYRLQASSGTKTTTASLATVAGITTTDADDFGIYFRLKTDATGANRYAAITSFDNGSGNGARDLVLQDLGGNVGIGVTPSAWGSTYRALQIGLGTSLTGVTNDVDVNLVNNARFDGTNWKYTNSSPAERYRAASGTHYWYNAASGTAGNNITWTQAMTLGASGALLIGQTTAGLDAQGGFWLREASSAFGSSIIINHRTAVGTGNSYAEFTHNGVVIGSISQNGTTGVLYNTTSDYRLKESVQPIANGLARVNALKPSIYKWKADGSSGEGFLAHELAEVVPAAVSGEKDAVNEDGSIKAQGVDMSRVVPILVAAIQELTARVQTLETR